MNKQVQKVAEVGVVKRSSQRRIICDAVTQVYQAWELYCNIKSIMLGDLSNSRQGH